MNSYDIKCKVIEEELRSVWPEWYVVGRLGGGAFGDVFQIYRDNYGIRLDSALKVIQVNSGEITVKLPANGQNDGEAEAESRSEIPAPLRSEIQIIEALRGQPNIVDIEDFSFKRDGTTSSLFVRMELLTSLQEILQGREGINTLSSIREIVKLGRDICRALMYCEKKGIIHRDIKPANLFVDRFGDYKVGDFGVSKRMDTVHFAPAMISIGTIPYMAPEIFQGRSYNNTADIYSLGLVLCQLLNNGRMPFLPDEDSYTTQAVDRAIFQRLHGMPIPCLTGRSVGGEMIDSLLDAVVRKACEVDPEDRYQTAKEFYDALVLWETAAKKPEPAYTKRMQGSLASAASLQNRQLERNWSEQGIKPSSDLESAVSVNVRQQEKVRSGAEEKASATLLPVRPSQSRLQQSGQSGSEKKTSTTPPLARSSQGRLQKKRLVSRNDKPLIVIVLLLIIALTALAASLSRRGSFSFSLNSHLGSPSEKEDRVYGSITDSWEEIIAAGEDGTYIDKYKIGDTKELDLGKEGVIEMELVAFDADELADGSGKATMTWIAKDLLKTKYVMNKEMTNKGGWPVSDMRAWLRESVLPLFPEEVRSNIMEVKKYSFSGSDSGTLSSSDTIWIPSGREMFGADCSYENVGTEYMTAFQNEASRQKHPIGDSEPSWWWLRSASANSAKIFYFVGSDGSSWNSNYASSEIGVAVGFCLGSSKSSLNTPSEEDKQSNSEEDQAVEEPSPDTKGADTTSGDDNSFHGSITDSWEEIIAAGEDGTYVDKYKIGDTKELDLGKEGVIEMELVAFDADELADGSGKAHMTWIAKDLLNTEHAMNEEWTNEGGWPESEMRAWLRESVLPLFPEKVRSNIIEVKKYSYSLSDSTTISSSDTIWIPSKRELFGADSAHEDKGPEYMTAFPDEASRQKHHIGISEPLLWWLRSAYPYDDDYFSRVGDDGFGGGSSGANSKAGVAVGFCL